MKTVEIYTCKSVIGTKTTTHNEKKKKRERKCRIGTKCSSSSEFTGWCKIRSFVVRDCTTRSLSKRFSLSTLFTRRDWLDWEKHHVEAAILSDSPTYATTGAFL
jgi:recombinational DNA repair ATPase RecF